jgi:hypothetical protein
MNVSRRSLGEAQATFSEAGAITAAIGEVDGGSDTDAQIGIEFSGEAERGGRRFELDLLAEIHDDVDNLRDRSTRLCSGDAALSEADNGACTSAGEPSGESVAVVVVVVVAVQVLLAVAAEMMFNNSLRPRGERTSLARGDVGAEDDGESVALSSASVVEREDVAEAGASSVDNGLRSSVDLSGPIGETSPRAGLGVEQVVDGEPAGGEADGEAVVVDLAGVRGELVTASAASTTSAPIVAAEGEDSERDNAGESWVLVGEASRIDDLIGEARGDSTESSDRMVTAV